MCVLLPLDLCGGESGIVSWSDRDLVKMYRYSGHLWIGIPVNRSGSGRVSEERGLSCRPLTWTTVSDVPLSSAIYEEESFPYIMVTLSINQRAKLLPSWELRPLPYNIQSRICRTAVPRVECTCPGTACPEFSINGAKASHTALCV